MAPGGCRLGNVLGKIFTVMPERRQAPEAAIFGLNAYLGVKGGTLNIKFLLWII